MTRRFPRKVSVQQVEKWQGDAARNRNHDLSSTDRSFTGCSSKLQLLLPLRRCKVVCVVLSPRSVAI
ncbi:hypothetical protein JTE90_023168 [Oedothorax gibbosus]|uniref:Uncharacterized protein n=1 Tax=Oedothorax gibbosus TaxID=931172 RepID=A0AAV6URK1_9ARAC|nr:hypothetical protein JTE90_023168 [Oedothorax gibbosus]